jgi:hypothetical protein
MACLADQALERRGIKHALSVLCVLETCAYGRRFV